MNIKEAIFKTNQSGGAKWIQFSLVIALILIIIAAIGLMYWVSRTEYAVLFTDMRESDTASVVKQLDRMKIDYKVDAENGSVLVPKDAVHKVRLDLMGSGVPIQGGVGFELFDKDDFGTTEFAQKINYQRALQGELARTITAVDSIKLARVHLVLPENNLFKEGQSTASASVTLVIKDSVVLDRAQVVGIQRLVASAVPGLKVANVVVLNQVGVTLSESPVSDQQIESAHGRLRTKKEMEAYLEDKVRRVLLGIVGSDQSSVSIDVSLNLDQVKSTTEAIANDGNNESAIIRKRTTKTSSKKGTSDADSNSTIEVEYELGKQVQQTVVTPGSISRISVAVVLPAKFEGGSTDELTTLIAATVGLDATRGDKIAISRSTSGNTSNTAGIGAVEDLIQPNGPVSDENIIADARQGARKPVAFSWPNALHDDSFQKAVGALVVLVIVLLAILIYLIRKAAVKRMSQDMTAEERSAALAEVRQWLAEVNHNG